MPGPVNRDQKRGDCFPARTTTVLGLEHFLATIVVLQSNCRSLAGIFPSVAAGFLESDDLTSASWTPRAGGPFTGIKGAFRRDYIQLYNGGRDVRVQSLDLSRSTSRMLCPKAQQPLA